MGDETVEEKMVEEEGHMEEKRGRREVEVIRSGSDGLGGAGMVAKNTGFCHSACVTSNEFISLILPPFHSV